MWSAPVPPITIALPSPTVIESSPPFAAPGYVVCTMPTVIGSVPKRFVSEPAAKIRPLSPRMMFVPEPPRIVSLPAPPTTIARPAPIVIWSSPPSVESVEPTRSMFFGLLFWPAHVRLSGFCSVPTHVM